MSPWATEQTFHAVLLITPVQRGYYSWVGGWTLKLWPSKGKLLRNTFLSVPLVFPCEDFRHFRERGKSQHLPIKTRHKIPGIRHFLRMRCGWIIESFPSWIWETWFGTSREKMVNANLSHERSKPYSIWGIQKQDSNFLIGIEPTTFRTPDRCSTHWATERRGHMYYDEASEVIFTRFIGGTPPA